MTALYTFEQLKDGYTQDLKTYRLLSTKVAAVNQVCAQIRANQERYEGIQVVSDVPWYVIACIHYRESSLDFGTYLGNGDNLSRPTTHVPAHRGPFSSFELGAIDALAYDGLNGSWLTKASDWSPEREIYSWEKYNGFGPRMHGKRSGYLWSGSNLYTGGKYIRDGVWSSGTYDTQLGVCCIALALMGHLGE